MHQSQAFAAFRTSLVADLQDNIRTELLPTFNSEVEDIRRTTEEVRQTRGDALARHHQRARAADLKIRQERFLADLNGEMRKSLEQRIADYGGKVVTKKEGEREVLEATFEDGSTARVPKSLWIDFNMFDKL